MTDHAEAGASGFAGGDEHAARANSQIRRTPQHTLLVVAVSVLAVAPAAAEPRVTPNDALGVEVAGGGFGLDEGDVSVGAIGTQLELALGRERWQYFISGFAGYAIAEHGRVTNEGFALRPAVGARYVARSFAFGDEAALELGFEGSVGMDLVWWRGGTSSRRPDLQLGVDWQARMFDGRLRAVRLLVALAFAPADDPQQMFACRGTCPTIARPALTRGMVAAMGVAW